MRAVGPFEEGDFSARLSEVVGGAESIDPASDNSIVESLPLH